MQADEDEAAHGQNHAEKRSHDEGSDAAETMHKAADKAADKAPTWSHPSAGKAAEAVAHVAKPAHLHHTPAEVDILQDGYLSILHVALSSLPHAPAMLHIGSQKITVASANSLQYTCLRILLHQVLCCAVVKQYP